MSSRRPDFFRLTILIAVLALFGAGASVAGPIRRRGAPDPPADPRNPRIRPRTPASH